MSRIVLFLVPVVSLSAIGASYGSRALFQNSKVPQLACALIVALSSAVGFTVGGALAIGWSVLNTALGLGSAWGIVDEASSHNSHSGYAALIFIPVFGVTLLSQLAFACVATWLIP